MRKKMSVLAVFMTVALLTTACGQAAAGEIVEGMGNKAVSGAVDMVTGVIEIPMQIYKGYDNGVGLIQNKVASKTIGTVLGIFRGFGHAAGRTAWGGMELLGFWSANALDNKGVGVPLDAQYAWEIGDRHSYFEPTLVEGVKPVGRKLARGVTDSLLGVLEVPGQMKLGELERNYVAGSVRGVWFWWSRELYGFGSVLTCIVPNPEDNPGYALYGDWPWSALAE